LVVLGKTRHQKRSKKVKRESLGEGESGAGCWHLGLQTMTSDQMKKIIPNTQKTPDEKVGVVGLLNVERT